MIVCLGWGSLIWNAGDLPVKGVWNDDGPQLPVEFARVSQNGRLTLVVAKGVAPVPVLWSRLSVDTIDDGITALAKREGVSSENAQLSIGFWTPEQRSQHIGADDIAVWAEMRDFHGVVWTALKPRYNGSSGLMPTQSNALGHLRGLVGEQRENAEEYVRRAPDQIRTTYRTAIEDEFGWVSI